MNPARAQADKGKYYVFINLATGGGASGYGGRIYDLEGDMLMVMDLVKRAPAGDTMARDFYDTTRYEIGPDEQKVFQNKIKSLDSLNNVRNACLDDGLRFLFSCGIDNKELNSDIANAYDEKVYWFVDMINAHLPKKFRILYQKDALITLKEDCDKYMQGK